MLDNQLFDPEKLSIIEFKFIKGQVETPEDFYIDQVEGHQLENTLQLAFNLEEKLVKVDYKVEIKFSINYNVIECASVSFDFNMKNLKTEFGIANSRFPYYVIENEMIEISEGLSSDCTSKNKVNRKIFSSQNLLLEYQSYYARPFYIPQNWTLEYRIWKADDKFTSMN